jgi:hypothetical protein
MGPGEFVEFVGLQHYLFRPKSQSLGRRHGERHAGDEGFTVQVDGVVMTGHFGKTLDQFSRDRNACFIRLTIVNCLMVNPFR